MSARICPTVVLAFALAFVAAPLQSQEDSSGAAPAGEEPPMITPAPVSTEGYSLDFTSETPRTNYVRGALNFGSGYDDNILPSSGQAVSDVRYSVRPSISLVQSRSRLAWELNYSPGFGFYQHNSSMNEVDHDLALDLEYRLSPHVTLSLKDSFQKTSNMLNLSEQNVATSGDGVTHPPADSLVAPGIAKTSNFADVELTYQFGPNAMVGAKGTVSGLWYASQADVSGLYDSTTQGAEVFYAHRLSGRHYVGATYGFQKFHTHPDQGETQTHSTLAFYTLYLPPTLAVSLFAGPEYSDTSGGTSVQPQRWTPAAGASLGWHRSRASFAASYAHRISAGGGLSGAVRSNNADASVRWQLARTVTTSLGAGYSTNQVLDALPSSGIGGHTWSGTASLSHPLGERLAMQIGYTRLHQSYSSVAAISGDPDRNSAWVSFSYQFERPLGR